MNARQFIAPTAREAMAMARKALGPDAVILNNRKTSKGICVTAMQEADLIQLDPVGATDDAEFAQSVNEHEQAAWENAGRRLPVDERSPQHRTQITARPATPEPMSTVNFQRYANERRARTPAPTPAAEVAGARSPRAAVSAQERASVEAFPEPVRALRAEHGSEDLAAANETEMTTVLTPATVQEETASELLAMAAELRQMRSFISQQFSALSWVDGVRRTPGQAQVLRRLLQAGFSSPLARSLVGHLPEGCIGQAADDWLGQALARNLNAPSWTDNVINAGGVFALVGPTGVGKTTSVAKIAARCALEHGVDEVGLITADAYRVGAQDQLRRFGSMIGITVHTAHDAQSLHGLLSLLQSKRIVLIDTAGLGQRDPRVTMLVDAVSQGPIQRLLVLSAAAQIESIREAIESYEGNDCAGVLLTKVDEACRLGGALDSLIRFRLPLLAVANGQRVPEDWHDADVDSLVRNALTSSDADDAGLPDIDLTMLMQRVDSRAGSSGSPATPSSSTVAGAL
ncbi:MAG: flagellar biosynthesis protein FlhF [Burkholderiaceae bacterium]